jgi:hypothetical protein
MTDSADVLGDLRRWFDERKAALAHDGYDAEFRESPPDRSKQSVSVIISSSRRIGQLVVWDTGEAALSMGDVDSGNVVDEHREITSQIGLRDATQTLLSWLGEP